VEGADVVVRLSANATTGYQWFVKSTDRTFGYPEQTYEYAEGGPVGSGGTAVLTWHTGGFVRAGGSHTVALVYARSASGSPARTFTFTANVVAPE
jgi:predicted secreted protein